MSRRVKRETEVELQISNTVASQEPSKHGAKQGAVSRINRLPLRASRTWTVRSGYSKERRRYSRFESATTQILGFYQASGAHWVTERRRRSRRRGTTDLKSVERRAKRAARAERVDLSPATRGSFNGVTIVFKFVGNCRHLFRTGRPFRRQWIDKFRGLESGNVPRQTLRKARSGRKVLVERRRASSSSLLSGLRGTN